MTATVRTYRFGDSSTPGVLLGLSVRQAVPVIAGVLWLAAALQAPLGALAPVSGLAGLAVGGFVAFGRWRGAPVTEISGPGLRLSARHGAGRKRWTRAVLLGTPTGTPRAEPVPPTLAGLELLSLPLTAAGSEDSTTMAVVRDRRCGTLTAVLSVSGNGFPLATQLEQDAMLSRWDSALSTFASDQSPVTRVVWQESLTPTRGATDIPLPAPTTEPPGGQHRGGTTQAQIDAAADPATAEMTEAAADYRSLVTQQAPAAREVLVTLTVDQRRVRAPRQRTPRARLHAALDVLAEETKLFRTRLGSAGLSVQAPLDTASLATIVRRRSDPSCAGQLATLAAAAGRATPEWAPMAVEARWGRVRVDGAWHRSYRIAGWPALGVPADWLSPLLTGTDVTRTVTVIMAPVPLSQSARTADREAMAREADADSRARRGFRTTAQDRKRLSEVEARERELAQGHAEFRFVALVDVCAFDEEGLDDATATIEQAAAQSLLDLRPLDARHELAWVASLPLGRNVKPAKGLGL